MGKIKTFLHLTCTERRIFFRAMYLLIHARVALRRQSFKTLIGGYSTSGVRTLPLELQMVPTDRLMRLFAAACRILPFTTCLSRAMAAQKFLMQYGQMSTLHIGVAREEEQTLEAHAWLTINDFIVLGHIPDLKRYRELPSFPDREVKKE